MKVLIFAEGGKEIGFGHLSRCIALYEAFEEKGVIPEIIANVDEEDYELLRGKKHKVINWVKDKYLILNSNNKSDIAIVDSYIADINFYNYISDLIRIGVYIDDNQRIDYPRGIVINPTIHAERFDYPNKKSIKYLLGSKYMPLRKEFWTIPKKNVNESIKKIMITFGGNDIRSLSPIVLKLLVREYQNLAKVVVIGKGYSNIDEIERIKDDNTNLIFFPDAEKISKIMLNTDIAISGGGQTLFELACMGVPTIAVCLALNQANNIEGFESVGFIKFAGWFNDKELHKKIISSINSLNFSKRSKMVQKGQKIVDGRGALRIISEIMDNIN